MKVLVCGSRTILDYALVESTIQNCGWAITGIISGAATGPDMLASLYAKKNNIPLQEFPAEWKKYGRGAGFRRNKEMVDIADGVIAIWDCISKGTAHTISLAKQKNIPLLVIECPTTPQS